MAVDPTTAKDPAAEPGHGSADTAVPAGDGYENELTATRQALRDTEERLNTIVNALHHVVWSVEPRTGQVLYVNGVAELVYGRSLDALYLGPGPWRDTVHPEDLVAFDQALDELRATGKCEVEHRIVRADGVTRWVHTRARTNYRADGKPREWEGITTDVTEGRAAVAALRASETNFRSLIERSPDGMLVHRDGVVVYANRALLDLLGGAAQGGLAGRPLRTLTHPDEHDLLEAELGTIPERHVAPSRDHRLRRADGSWAWVELNSMDLTYQAQHAVLTVVRDVSARRSMQRRLLLTDRMASLGTMAAGVAHEINNPLAYVVSNVHYALGVLDAVEAELGAQSALGARLAEARAALRDAQDGAQRVTQTVRELKTLSRQDDAHQERVDVQQVLETCIRMAWAEIKHRARLERDYGPTAPVLTSEARLGQVFLNLLVNAAQAIPEGNAQQHCIRVRTARDARGWTCVEVQDSGQGIAAEHRERLFDPFFTTKPVGVGTGLGLSICHSIVSGLGGEIQVDSELGRGSTFRVLFPPAGDAVEPRAAPPPQPTVPADVRGRVLVIDDDPTVGVGVARVLRKSHDVEHLVAARDALERINGGEAYDVIVCDVMMPDMGGVDFHERLVATGNPHAERVVFLTGGAFTPRTRDYLARPGFVVVEKPFHPPDLRALVDGRVKQRRGVRGADTAEDPQRRARPAG
ncbi:MAG: PAS domain S-box protein [Deltaproteobacteria bacterium]|nr:PAS domain S-box protein [Deltaproteobacteria bacterium]